MNERSGELEALWTSGPASEQVREMIAAYGLENKERVRAIARRKLTPTSRRVFDSEEVLSSVLRRLDGMAVRGTLRPHSEAELWALIEAIARNTTVSKIR